MDHENPLNGWITTELGNISAITLGQSPPSSTYNKEKKGLPFFQGKADFGVINPTPKTWCDAPKKIAEKNDILISVRAPVGSTNISMERCCIGRGLSAIRTLEVADTLYVFYQLRHLERYISKKGTGTTFKAITGTQLKSIGILLPPIREQKRIVSKIESIFAQIDAAGRDLEGLASNISSARDSLGMLKGSILKRAFEGRLVPQDPNDESSEILLKSIHENFKKMEFERSVLPNDWVWARIQDVCTPPQYGYTTSADKIGNTQLLRTTDITSPAIDWSKVPYCKEEPKNLRKYLLEDGDVVISRAGSVGVSCIIRNPKKSVFASYLIRFKPLINNQFFAYFLNSPFYWSEILDRSVGIAVANVNATKLKLIPIPIPPLPEQKRIVSKIESIFSEIDATVQKIKSKIWSTIMSYVIH